MANIGFFTPEHHSFFLYYLSRVPDPTEHDVTVYTTLDIHDDIEPLYTEDQYDEIEWTLQRGEEKIDDFFHRVERSAERDQDLLWTVLAWGTERVPPNFLDFDPTVPSICGLTNLNDWTYNPFPGWVYSLVEVGTPFLRRSLDSPKVNRFFDHSRFLMQPGIIDNFDAVHMEYPPMCLFLKNEADWDVEFYEFYPVVHEPEKLPTVESNENRRIVVPGRISQNVRNVHLLLDAMETVLERYDGEPVLDFVGRPTGEYEEVFERIEGLRERGYNVRYREEWIPYEEFAADVTAADVLVNPLQVRRTIKHPLRADMWTGRTNGTGIVFDALRYARPLVVPELFSVDNRIEPFTVTYDNVDHLSDILVNLLSDEDRLRTMQDAADRAAHDVSVEAQRPRFDAIVEDLIR